MKSKQYLKYSVKLTIFTSLCVSLRCLWSIRYNLYSFVTKGGSEGEGDGQFLHPHVPANDAQGNLFVTNRDLQMFRSSQIMVIIMKSGIEG